MNLSDPTKIELAVVVICIALLAAIVTQLLSSSQHKDEMRSIEERIIHDYELPTDATNIIKTENGNTVYIRFTWERQRCARMITRGSSSLSCK